MSKFQNVINKTQPKDEDEIDLMPQNGPDWLVAAMANTDAQLKQRQIQIKQLHGIIKDLRNDKKQMMNIFTSLARNSRKDKK